VHTGGAAAQYNETTRLSTILDEAISEIAGIQPQFSA